METSQLCRKDNLAYVLRQSFCVPNTTLRGNPTYWCPRVWRWVLSFWTPVLWESISASFLVFSPEGRNIQFHQDLISPELAIWNTFSANKVQEYFLFAHFPCKFRTAKGEILAWRWSRKNQNV